MSEAVVLPGRTIGILGGGQLGRMTALAAKQMGYRVAVLTDADGSPAAQVADHVTVAPYDDPQRAAEWAAHCDVVTVEFENIHTDVLKAAGEKTQVAPGPNVLYVAQNRAREKQTLQQAGVPVAPFAVIESTADLEQTIEQIGLPLVLKTAASGYDGKGQRMVRTREEAFAAREELDSTLVAEQLVDFAYEASVIVARNADGATVMYPPIENAHANHILDVSICPSARAERIKETCFGVARTVATALDLCGILCIELFVLDDDTVWVNEIAPRPHNSGHLTIEAFSSSQFETAVRAICNLPMRMPIQRRPAAMANLLGDLWEDGEPNWPAALEEPETTLHLYGKDAARRGRKMGHLTTLADTIEEAERRVRAARDKLVVTTATASS